MPLYLGDIEIAAGGGTAITPQTIIDFLLGDDPVDWCGLSDGFGVTGQVFGLIIGHDFDAYTSLPTAQAIADDADAKQAVKDSQDAQDAVGKSLIAIAAGLQNIVLPAIGDAFMGGFYAGTIDSTQSGAIPANDYYQTGQKYALIDLGAASEAPSTLRFKTSNDAAPAQCSTVWNGLGATQAMITVSNGTGLYPAAEYAAGYSVDDNGASPPYILSMWEQLSVFWLFKPMTDDNYTTNMTGATFPFTPIIQGVCPIAVPQRSAFTTAVPGQTALAAWKSGGVQAFKNSYYWCSTEYSTTYAWVLGWFTSGPGNFSYNNKDTFNRVRLFRRFAL